MIQRIQTLFLVIAFGLLISLFFTPMAHIGDEIVKYTEFYPYLIFILITVVLCGFIIFSYKNRLLQIRLCILSCILLVAFQIWIAVKFFTKDPEIIFTLTAVFPIIAAILEFIALRYIARDEAMVMAAQRLRGIKRK